jgi:hypothetical protein
VGWHTTLREAVVHLLELRHHPLEEVREVAESMSEVLHKKYPSSGFGKRYKDTEAYVESYMSKYTYMEPQNMLTSGEFLASNTFSGDISFYDDVLESRPPKTELPAFLKKFGDLKTSFFLDFASFRDLQRHRSGIILMPLLTTKYGFHEWYIEQIPEEYKAEILGKIKNLVSLVNGMDFPPEVLQYYIAMGFKVPCECTFDLPASVYVAELRSTKAVHSTLRTIAQKTGKELQRLFPRMNIYCDMEPDEWSTIRGKHDIVKKD